MRLLVSVRSAAEVAAAVAGGADIVDAKEPDRGSLGAVSPPVLRAIVEALPAGTPLSVALGDLRDPSGVPTAIQTVDAIRQRPRELFVKLGLAGVRDAAMARAVLAAAVQAARAGSLRPGVVAVAYADHDAAGALAGDVVSAMAAEVGARGVLLDTWTKDGRDLFAWTRPEDVRRWVERSKQRGLLTALAGSLSTDGVRQAGRLSADIVGVRGAACAGGRAGAVEETLVRALAAAVSSHGRGAEAVA